MESDNEESKSERKRPWTGKIESILDALSVAVFIVDADQTITYRNSASVSLFGTGLRNKKLSHFVPNKRCIRAVDDVLDGTERQSVDVRLQLVVPTSFRMTAVLLQKDAERSETSAVVSFEDVSHILEAEQMRTDFVANVSHGITIPADGTLWVYRNLAGASAIGSGSLRPVFAVDGKRSRPHGAVD